MVVMQPDKLEFIKILRDPRNTDYFVIGETYANRWRLCSLNTDELQTRWMNGECVVCNESPSDLIKAISWVTFFHPMSPVTILDQASWTICCLLKIPKNSNKTIESYMELLTPFDFFYHFHLNRCELVSARGTERDFIKVISQIRYILASQCEIKKTDLINLHVRFSLIKNDRPEEDPKKLECCNSFKLKTVARTETLRALLPDVRRRRLDVVYLDTESADLHSIFDCNDEQPILLDPADLSEKRCCKDRMINWLWLMYGTDAKKYLADDNKKQTNPLEEHSYFKINNQDDDVVEVVESAGLDLNKTEPKLRLHPFFDEFQMCFICDLKTIGEMGKHMEEMEKEPIHVEQRMSVMRATFERIRLKYLKFVPVCLHRFFTVEALQKHMDIHNRGAVLCHYNKFAYADFLAWFAVMQKLQPEHLIDGTFAKIFENCFCNRLAAPCPKLLLAVFMYFITNKTDRGCVRKNSMWIYTVLDEHGIYDSRYQL